ncbi:DegV family protein [Erysipelothrix sp. HDW6A]|uniref:DegV family protein n=1 Tax=Erysipelothrix sp. HDW6A TaxID=2714928 RepID=UPI00140BBAEA|nr:DegV family protein [Erysipelothrix sp. HDW6A]QIK58125.1 DegV family protein [Erysipelothrix sp. HDW6A]
MHILTDSASDITLEEAKLLKIDIVPLTTTFGDEVLPQESHEDFDKFFKRLMESDTLPVTSQPSPAAYLEYYNKYDEDILVITLSTGLSGTYNSANLAKDTSGKDNIWIVDSKTAILGQRILVEHAVKLRDEGKSVQEIAEKLESIKDRVLTFGALDTLKYLKMGGRIPTTLATVGEFLRIKPTIVLQDGELKELGLSRGRKKAVEMLQHQIDKYGIDTDYPIYFGYTLDRENGAEFMEETEMKYNINDAKMVPVGGIIGTHVGPNCLAFAFVIKDK